MRLVSTFARSVPIVVGLSAWLVGCGPQDPPGNEARMNVSGDSSRAQEQDKSSMSERFEESLTSPDLVRGSVLLNAEVYPRDHRVKIKQESLNFYLYPGRGSKTGSFDLIMKDFNFVGDVEFLRSDSQKDKRIYVLKNAREFSEGRPKNYTLSASETQKIANLIETFYNAPGQSSERPRGPEYISCYVLYQRGDA